MAAAAAAAGAASAAAAKGTLTRQSSAMSVASWFDNDDTQLLVERVCDALCDVLALSGRDASVCEPLLKRFVAATAADASAAAADTKTAPAGAAAASAGEPDTAALSALEGDLDDVLSALNDKLQPQDAAAAATAVVTRRQLSDALVALGGSALPDAYLNPDAAAAASAAPAATAVDAKGSGAEGSADADAEGEGEVAAGPFGPPTTMSAGGSGAAAADSGTKKAEGREKRNIAAVAADNKPRPAPAALAGQPQGPPGETGGGDDDVAETSVGVLMPPGDDDDESGGSSAGGIRTNKATIGRVGGGGGSKLPLPVTKKSDGSGAGAVSRDEGIGLGLGTLGRSGGGMAGGGTRANSGGSGYGKGRVNPNKSASAVKSTATAGSTSAVMPTGAVLTVAQQMRSATIRAAKTKPPPVPQGYVKPASLGTVYAWGLAESLGKGGGSGADKKLSGVAPEKVLGTFDTPVGGGVKFVHVSCGLHFTACVSSDGRVYTFGNNGKEHNRLGLGADSADRYSVAQLVLFPVNSAQTPQPFIVRVACGTKHTLALTHSGQLYSWGDDSTVHVLGRAVNDKEQPAALPGRVKVVVDKVEAAMAHMSAGNRFSVCVTTAAANNGGGRVLAWGLNTSSQCGAPAATASFREPTVIDALNGAGVGPCVSVGCGFSWAGAVTGTGALYTWGNNADGQCGHGAVVKSAVVAVPTKVDTLSRSGDVKIVAFNGSRGEHHGSSMALDAAGRVWAWGDNYKFKLGLGDDTARPLPTRVGGDDMTAVAGLASGGVHAACWTRSRDGAAPAAGAAAPAAAVPAATVPGQCYVWGCGSDGRLGLPDISKRGQTARYLFKEKVPRSLHSTAAAGAAAAAAAGALPFKSAQRAVCMAADYYHTVAIVADK